MTFNPVLIVAKGARPEWYPQTASYARPQLRRSYWQLANSVLPYLLLLALMFFTVLNGYSYLITLALALVAAVFYVRIFIIFHDCVHGAFVNSPRWNRNIGYLCGIITMTAFADWRRTHIGHHIRAGDLDRRGTGDIWIMTVDEYRSATWLRRLAYRLYRHPLVLFGLGPIFSFLLVNRFPSKGANKRDLMSVVYTNLAVILIVVIASLTVGLKAYLLVQLPVIQIAGSAGLWLFYVQHQFQGVYWARSEAWDPLRVAMEGASFYCLPKFLQWATGNIGFHHLHHVRPAIPNYNLQACHEAIPVLKTIKPMSLRDSLQCVRLHLYDEEQQAMVGFGG